jgi:D-glucosaminate-6-phosphate ammonia-lyase
MNVNRRSFLTVAGLLSGSRAKLRFALGPAAPAKAIYDELGVRPFINAAGAYTNFGGALMRADVIEAMQDASLHSVSISELQDAVGKRIAAMLSCEAALVTAGCASSLTLATAACMAGKDADKIRRLPDSSGMRNEVIIQRAHRFDYDHAIRNVGAKLVEVDSAEELKAAVTPRTAMLFFLNSADAKGKIRREEFVGLAKQMGIPSLVDAAADLPPAENLWALTKMGFDLVGFSGGKSLGGPQCSGLLLGRKELIEAAFLNGSPHSDTLGRTSKVGKEEIVGIYRAVQLFVATDHKAEWAEWERRVAVIAEKVSSVPGVKAEMVVPEVPHHRPQVSIQWDREKIAISGKEIVAALRAGEPRIELPPENEESANAVNVAVWMLRGGEEAIVGRRIVEAFAERTQRGG